MGKLLATKYLDVDDFFSSRVLHSAQCVLIARLSAITILFVIHVIVTLDHVNL